MHADYKIRVAGPNDAPALTRLLRAAFSEVARQFGLTASNAPKHVSNCEESWIREALDKGVSYFVLEAGEECLGCVALERANSEVCYLERLAVHPEYQGKGLGVALVRHALEEARRQGALRVEIGIVAAHTRLHDWYAKRGFVDTGRKSFHHLPFEVGFMACTVSVS